MDHKELVHTSDGIGSGVGMGSARNATIQCKSKSGIVVRRIRRVSFSSDSASASFVPIHTRSELSSDSDLAYVSASVASVASVNQP